MGCLPCGMENFRLKVFRAVAEQASFRKASEWLHLSALHVEEYGIDRQRCDHHNGRRDLRSRRRNAFEDAANKAYVSHWKLSQKFQLIMTMESNCWD